MQTQNTLEHVNVTVSDPDKTAAVLCNLFDWKVRWQGGAKDGGYTVHVGNHDAYVAIYSPRREVSDPPASYLTRGGLNHIAIVVDDLDEIEKRVAAVGYKPHNHGDYEPGRRFYFHDDDGIEFEIVSYAEKKGH
jgi:catechol 2,3-dioxygenase-like lactoylglutathione lyase family enzyme